MIGAMYLGVTFADLSFASDFVEYSYPVLQEVSQTLSVEELFASWKLFDRHDSDFFLFDTELETFDRAWTGLLEEVRNNDCKLSRLFLYLSRLLQSRSRSELTLEASSAKHCLCLDLKDSVLLLVVRCLVLETYILRVLLFLEDCLLGGDGGLTVEIGLSIESF